VHIQGHSGANDGYGSAVPALFEFELFQQGGLLWHVVTAGDGELAAPCWPGLWEQTYPQDDRNPIWRFSVNNADGEILAVWRALAWTITNAPVQAVLPRSYRDQVASRLSVDRERLAFIRWEYEIDCESFPFPAANHGFVPAQSCIPISPVPTDWQMRHKDLAALFPASSLNMLHQVDAEISYGVESEMSVLGVTGRTFADLQNMLLADHPPDLADVLGRDGVLAHLTIVRDTFFGHHSYLAIASERDLSATLDSLNETYTSRCVHSRVMRDGVRLR
jgi:hypothetical protein